MDPRPNVLWLSLESVRADHTSLHGYHRDTTPHLKRLSERPDASALDLGCSASMWTPASTASMLTGTHMSTHQVGRDGMVKEKLPSSLDTLPELLAEAGYCTALFSTNSYIGSETGLCRGFEHYELFSGMSKSHFTGFDSVAADSWRVAFRRLVERPTFRPERLKREIASSRNSLLKSRVERWFTGGDSRNPFFVYAHIPSPHHPYRPIAKFRDNHLDGVELDVDEAERICGEVYTGSEGIKRRMANGLDLSSEALAGIKALYDAEIEYADHTANELIAAARSASDRPLVVVAVGDHGDLFGEYGLLGHNLMLHDGLIRVPMLVVGIDGIEDSEQTMSQQIDLTRTIASVCDVRTEQFQGRDLREADRPYAISQRGVAHLDRYTDHNSSFDTSRFFEQPFTCVRTPKWKYLENESRRALYRLPDEELDVKADHPEVVERLSETIEEEGIDWTENPEMEAVEFDEGTRDRLKDLGYLT